MRIGVAGAVSCPTYQSAHQNAEHLKGIPEPDEENPSVLIIFNPYMTASLAQEFLLSTLYFCPSD